MFATEAYDDGLFAVDCRELEGKFFGAFERGDLTAIAECYAPIMRVWNSLQQTECTGAEHLDALALSFPTFSMRRFMDVRTDPLADGFVRQHVITGVLNGAPVRIAMCIVCRVSAGKMTRLDEYLAFCATTGLLMERAFMAPCATIIRGEINIMTSDT